VNHDDWLDEDRYLQTQEIESWACIVGAISFICLALLATWILYLTTS